MRVAITTAIYGEYEYPKLIPHDLPDHISTNLFTDSERVAVEAAQLGWFPILDPMEDIATPMLKAKWWKTHPHAAGALSDVSIWLDGSMSILGSGEAFVENCLNALGQQDISFTPHPERVCIYPEAQVTKALARYADCDPIAQTEFYRNVVGHPEHWGLFASGAFTVRHNPMTKRFGEHWWNECVNWTYQDQLSLPVIVKLLADQGQLTWNKNMPWAKWWGIVPHGR